MSCEFCLGDNQYMQADTGEEPLDRFGVDSIPVPGIPEIGLIRFI